MIPVQITFIHSKSSKFKDQETYARFMKSLKSRINGIFRKEQQQIGTVISFPKSGRTWLRVMLDKLNIAMLYSHAGSEYNLSCHFANLPSPSSCEKQGKQLFLFRDPKDTVVSGYFQKSRRIVENVYSGTISEFIRDPRYGIEKIVRFNLEWLSYYERLGQYNHLSISYEALRRDPQRGLVAIYTYLKGYSPKIDLINNVVKETSFSRMQAQEKSGELSATYGRILAPANKNDPESLKVRKGKVGGYIDYMTKEDIDFCNSILLRSEYKSKTRDNTSSLLLKSESQLTT